jgi:hypothetical protein
VAFLHLPFLFFLRSRAVGKTKAKYQASRLTLYHHFSSTELSIVLPQSTVVPKSTENLLYLESVVQRERGTRRRDRWQLQLQQLRSINIAIFSEFGSHSTEASETSPKVENAIPAPQLVWVYPGKSYASDCCRVTFFLPRTPNYQLVSALLISHYNTMLSNEPKELRNVQFFNYRFVRAKNVCSFTILIW